MLLLILFDVPVYAASSQSFGSNVLRREHSVTQTQRRSLHTIWQGCPDAT